MTLEEAVEIILKGEVWDLCSQCKGAKLSPWALREGGQSSAPIEPPKGGGWTLSVDAGKAGAAVRFSAYGGGGGAGSSNATAGSTAGSGGSSPGAGQVVGMGWSAAHAMAGIPGGGGGAGGSLGAGYGSSHWYIRCSDCNGTGKQLRKDYAEACHLLDKPLPSI